MEIVDYLSEHKEARIKFKEHNDCTVMAWANCFDATYGDSLFWLKKHGRVSRKGMYEKDIRSALSACRNAKIKIGPYSKDNRLTLGQFVKKHAIGRYYVLVRGHALCVKNGTIYDHSNKPRRQVTFAARIYLKGEI
jgi:hypothetical protein